MNSFLPSFFLSFSLFFFFYYFRFCFSESESCSVMSNSLRSHGLYSLWNSPGQNTGVGSCSLLQGIFPTQRSNPGLRHCRWILYQLSHKGSPRILVWVAYPFPSGSSQYFLLISMLVNLVPSKVCLLWAQGFHSLPLCFLSSSITPPHFSPVGS